MKNGIYYVNFCSNNQDVGSGTVVVRDNTVNGGDYGYTYKGRINGDGVKLQISQHDKSARSVFPGVTNYNLDLKMQQVGENYQLQGNIEGMPSAIIQANVKYIGDVI